LHYGDQAGNDAGVSPLSMDFSVTYVLTIAFTPTTVRIRIQDSTESTDLTDVTYTKGGTGAGTIKDDATNPWQILLGDVFDNVLAGTITVNSVVVA
jgi:hypothetical protein